MNSYYASARGAPYQQSTNIIRNDQQMNEILAVNHNSQTPTSLYTQYFEGSPRYRSSRPGTVSSLPSQSIFTSDEDYVQSTYPPMTVPARGQQYQILSQCPSSSSTGISSPNNRDTFYLSGMNCPLPMPLDDSYPFLFLQHDPLQLRLLDRQSVGSCL